MENVESLWQDILIKVFNHYKAHGSGEISPYILKECAGTLDRSLELFLKKPMVEKSLQKKWKRANVLHVFKKGDRDIALNYWPIFLTSTVC